MAACLLCGSSQHKVIHILQQDDLWVVSLIFIEVLTQSLIKQGRGVFEPLWEAGPSCITGWPSPSVHSKANISLLWATRGRLKKASFKSNSVPSVLRQQTAQEGIQVGDSRVYVTHPLVDFS